MAATFRVANRIRGEANFDAHTLTSALSSGCSLSQVRWSREIMPDKLHLPTIEIGVQPANRHQFIMPALLDNLTSIDGENSVRVTDRRKAMGNNESRSPLS